MSDLRDTPEESVQQSDWAGDVDRVEASQENAVPKSDGSPDGHSVSRPSERNLGSILARMKRRFSDSEGRKPGGGSATGRSRTGGGRFVPINADAQMDSRNVIRFGKRRIAVGLFWQMADPVRSPAEQVREIATRTGQTWLAYVAHPEGSQMAPVRLEEELEAGMPAGATMFDPALGASWIGAFQVSPTHYWVVAIRDGAIIADAVGDHDAAWADFNDLLRAGGWASIQAPPDWHIPDAAHEPLASLLTESGSRIRHLSLLRAYWKRLLLVTLLFGSVLAGWQGYSWWVESERQAEIQRQRALQEQRRLAALEPSWSTMSLPMDFFQACRDAFSGAIFDAPGWAQQQIACTYSGEGKAEVTTSWARQMGQIHLLRMMRPDNHAATPILLDRNGDRATMSFQIETPARDKAVDAFGTAMLQPWPADVVERRILERFQVMGLTIRMVNREARANSNNRRTAQPLFGHHEIGFSTSAGIVEHISLLGDVPAAGGQSIIFDPQTGVFDVEIRVYHPPILPIQLSR